MALLDHIGPPRLLLLRLLLFPALLILLPPSAAPLPRLPSRRPGWNPRGAKSGGHDTCRVVMLRSSNHSEGSCVPPIQIRMLGTLCQRLEMHCAHISGSFFKSVQALQRFERDQGRITLLWAIKLLPQWRLLASTFRVPFFVAEADFPLANMVRGCYCFSQFSMGYHKQILGGFSQTISTLPCFEWDSNPGSLTRWHAR